MLQATVVFTLLFGLSAAHWEIYKKVHKKSYGAQEDVFRHRIFDKTFNDINQHNLRHDLGLTTYRMGVNFFTDMTNEEYRMYRGLKFNSSEIHRFGSVFRKSAVGGDLPESVDLREEGYVTPVKNQGGCSSCWSFSTTGAVEGQNFKKTGKLVSLSEQQLVDCSGDFQNHGCSGGLMDNAFKYITSVGGIEKEDAYPYTGVDGQCKADKSRFVATVIGYVDIPAGDEDALKEAIAKNGPVSVGIDASHPNFKSYRSGVYDEPACSSTELDHGILVVGYGRENGADFWLIKNSWSTIWGESGYAKMARNKDNHCGIASAASYPTV